MNFYCKYDALDCKEQCYICKLQDNSNHETITTDNTNGAGF